MKPVTIKVEQFNDESGVYYVATCIEYPGYLTEGETMDEVIKNLDETLGRYIDQVESQQKSKSVVHFGGYHLSYTNIQQQHA